MHDVVDVALMVARAFDACNIPYFLGGSLASSFQGEPRATNDIDFVIRLTPEQVLGLAKTLGNDFEVDVVALERAAQETNSWNIIYMPTITKIDLFVCQAAPFDLSEFSRREAVEIRPGETLFIKTPEDTVLRKLLWYREGGGVSDRQWRDLVQVLRHSRIQIDNHYLDVWASRLGLDEMLAKARLDASP